MISAVTETRSVLFINPLRNYGWRFQGASKWLSRDPDGEASGLDLYDYVGNNPINDIDPEGLCDSPPAGQRPGDWAAYSPEQSKAKLQGLYGSTLIADGNGKLAAFVNLGNDNLNSAQRAIFTGAKTAHEIKGHGVDALASNPNIAVGLQAGQIIHATNVQAAAASEVRASQVELDYYKALLANPADLSDPTIALINANIKRVQIYQNTNRSLCK